MSKLRESLVVLERNMESYDPVFAVWISFTKLFVVNVNIKRVAPPRGFRKSGEPIVEILEDYLATCKLVVYEPYIKRIDTLVIESERGTFSVYPYMETLLLLDQPDLTVYNGMKTLKFQDDLCKELNLDRLIRVLNPLPGQYTQERIQCCSIGERPNNSSNAWSMEVLDGIKWAANLLGGY
ncbi:hypothetical protein L1987_28701 [Smallanthus sonchifolius]|uniref:Uncharacterized protein n=1 Tax=Smallanthus sonchifolius TaxID=185202 RepID=A0ACB9HYS9_9ASTR|nr:hypothetical protein L1987_28701 [Smallanthus sonchifolius]